MGGYLIIIQACHKFDAMTEIVYKQKILVIETILLNITL